MTIKSNNVTGATDRKESRNIFIELPHLSCSKGRGFKPRHPI
jgi:hypothetical protein